MVGCMILQGLFRCISEYFPVSPVARPILPIVNPEMFTVVRFFLLKCIHIGYWKLLSFVGIEKTLGNFFC